MPGATTAGPAKRSTLQEWDQRTADNRDLQTMRHVALDALQFEDDDAFYTYARDHHLTVDEVVYYLNAYEAGGDVGLEAIRNPDIIPPDEARRTIRKIGRILDDHFQGDLQGKLQGKLQGELPHRLTDEGTAIGIYHIQERDDGEKYLFPICQLRATRATRQWHLYWIRKFGAWWPYSLPAAGRMQQVLEDEYGCFWV